MHDLYDLRFGKQIIKLKSLDLFPLELSFCIKMQLVLKKISCIC